MVSEVKRATSCCPFCGKDTSQETYRDESSKAEAKISGLCQKCQDEFFGVKS